MGDARQRRQERTAIYRDSVRKRQEEEEEILAQSTLFQDEAAFEDWDP